MDLYKNKLTQMLGEGDKVKGFSHDLIFKARRKIEMIKASKSLEDLKAPPSNNLEKLKGNRKNQWSIRVNNQYRICFEWNENRAENIEFIDYH